MIRPPVDHEALRQRYLKASPFLFVKIETFFDRAFADEVITAFTRECKNTRHNLQAVNQGKEIAEAKLFAQPIELLSEVADRLPRFHR